MLAGICGGLAAYFGVDPLLVRIVFVAGIFMGWGPLVYILLWIVMPRDGAGTSSPMPVSREAVGIAEERYARGEITAEELSRIRAHLSAG
jgi:phage shock protein PspC (stress-responsive transcriptional regulator)